MYDAQRSSGEVVISRHFPFLALQRQRHRMALARHIPPVIHDNEVQEPPMSHKNSSNVMTMAGDENGKISLLFRSRCSFSPRRNDWLPKA